MTRTHLIWFLSVGVACAESERFVRLPELPEGTQSVFIVQLGDRVDVFAYLATDVAFDAQLDGTSVFLLAARERLDQLGVGEGPLPRAPQGACRPTALPPGVHFALDDETWHVLEDVPAEIDAFRFDGRCPCEGYESIERLEVVGASALDNGLMLGDVLITQSTALHVIGLSGASTAAVSGLSTGFSDHYRAPDGSVWFVSLGGSVSRWVPGAPPEAIESPATPYQGIDGVRGGGAFEAYTIDTEGIIRRTDGQRWTVVQGEHLAGLSGRQSGRIVWTGPGELVATVNDSQWYVLVTPKGVEVLDRGLGVGEIVELSSGDSGLVTAGTKSGEILLLDERQWRPIESSVGIQGEIEGFLPAEQGFWYVGGSILGRAHPDVEGWICPPTPLGDLRPRQVLGYGARLVVTGADSSGQGVIEVLQIVEPF